MSETVPEGWIRGRLDSVVSKFIVPMRDKPKTFSGDIPWVRIEDFNGKYLSGSKSDKNVDRNTIESMNLKVYPRGTVLCSCSARLGVCAITSIELVSNQTFIGLHPSDRIDAEMLFYTMESHSEDLQKLSSGTTIAYLPREKFEEFEILIPPLPEQKKIASILTSVDEVIETTQKQIEKLQDLKKATMNELLTKGIGHTEFKDSELGRIPKSWEVKTVDDIATDGTRNGLYKPKSHYGFGYEMVHMTQVFGMEEIRNGNMQLVNVDTIKENDFLLKEGDLLFARRSLVAEGSGKCSIIGKLTEPVSFESSIIRVRLDHSLVVPLFCYYYFSSKMGHLQMMKLVRQVAVSGITGSDLLGYKIPLPSILEQNSIAEIISSIEKSISEKQNKLVQTQSLKKSLMQDLLTGKVRVPVN